MDLELLSSIERIERVLVWCPDWEQNYCGKGPSSEKWDLFRISFQMSRTRFEIAVLNSTNKASSWAERSMLWIPRNSFVVKFPLMQTQLCKQTFEVKGHNKTVINWCHWHPNPLCRPHGRTCKWRVHKVIKSKAFADRLFPHGRDNFNRLHVRNRSSDMFH